MKITELFKGHPKEPGLEKFLVGKKRISLPSIFIRAVKLNRKISFNWFESISKRKPDVDFDQEQLKLNDLARENRTEKLLGNNHENRFIAYNCHIFFLIALGYKLSLKKVKELPNYKHLMPSFFQSHEYLHYSSKQDIKKHLLEVFDKTKSNIVGCQFSNSDQQNIGHSNFAVKSGEDIYFFDKGGYGFVDSQGIPFDEYFNDDIFKDIPREWGGYFACDSWVNLANKQKVKNQVEEFNLS